MSLASGKNTECVGFCAGVTRARIDPQIYCLSIQASAFLSCCYNNVYVDLEYHRSAKRLVRVRAARADKNKVFWWRCLVRIAKGLHIGNFLQTNYRPVACGGSVVLVVLYSYRCPICLAHLRACLCLSFFFVRWLFLRLLVVFSVGVGLYFGSLCSWLTGLIRLWYLARYLGNRALINEPVLHLSF